MPSAFRFPPSAFRILNSAFPNLRLLFVHNHLASFVRIDRDLLRERYAVREWFQRGRAVNLVALRRAIAECDLVFGWFASWHTFLPVQFARVFHKPSLLVVGGYDSANMPEIGYGNLRGGFKARVTRATMQNATALVTNSNFTREEVIHNAQVAPERVTAIYHGLEAIPAPTLPKENLVLTVGNVDRDNLERKGLEAFVRAAAYLPNIPFVVVGAWRDDAVEYLKRIASSNVEFTGWVETERLEKYLARARVYVQPSRHEGFGMAVAEAMLHQCIPVVTRAGALPEVVGDAGMYADSREPRAVADAIQHALTLDARWGDRARERIWREFPIERRREKMFALLDTLTTNDG
jgi:glycosyltransferase involved in cell wall biosynthesis